MNILILSSGTRIKIVEYFKRELQGRGKVVCADASTYAPTLYFADKYYIVPKIDSSNYIDEVFKICKKEDISGVFSLIDPELTLLSRYQSQFMNNNILVYISDQSSVEMSFDKYMFYKFCKSHDIPTVKSYPDLNKFQEDLKEGNIEFPVFVKPRSGSCSMQTQKIDQMEELIFAFNHNSDLIIQEYMMGKEFGVDVYIDMISGEIISIFIKEKLLMRAGETDKSRSFKDEALFELIKKFVTIFGFKGQIDIDVFLINGQYYISEVNPRFGGGYPHAYECGCNFPSYMINNLKGIINNPCIGEYKENQIMMKYLDLFLKDEG